MSEETIRAQANAVTVWLVSDQRGPTGARDPEEHWLNDPVARPATFLRETG